MLVGGRCHYSKNIVLFCSGFISAITYATAQTEHEKINFTLVDVDRNENDFQTTTISNDALFYQWVTTVVFYSDLIMDQTVPIL